MDFSMYDTLLGLPLFQGLSKAEFEQVLAKVRFDFSSVQNGTRFICAGDRCDCFVFLISGNAVSRRTSSDCIFSLSEKLSATLLLEPYSMFGMQPFFVKDYIAEGTAGILRVDKQYLYSELYKYSICRMNLLNMLSGRIQALESDLWNLAGCPLRERIIFIVRRLSDLPNGCKEVRVKMDDFAGILGETRLNVSRTLNALQDEGLIVLKRGGFDVPELERLD